VRKQVPIFDRNHLLLKVFLFDDMPCFAMINVLVCAKIQIVAGRFLGLINVPITFAD